MKPWSAKRAATRARTGTGTGAGSPATTPPRPPDVDVTEQGARADDETARLMQQQHDGQLGDETVNHLGPPVNRRSPFYLGLMAGLGLLVSYGLVHVLLELTQILTFLLVALFLALGLDPLVTGLVRRGMRRGGAVLVVVLGLLAVVALVGWIVVPTFVDQVTLLIGHVPGYLGDLETNAVVARLDDRFHLVQQLQERAQSSVDAGTLTSLLGGVLGAGKAVVDGVVAVVTVLVLTIYLMATLPAVKAACYKLVPQRRRGRVVFLGEEISRRVGGYVLGQVTVATINGFLTWAMLMVVGLPFPAVLAVLAGLLALVPIVGTIVGGVAITLVALSAGWVTAAIALGYYVAYHVFEAYVLSPRIMSRAVDVPAVVTVVAVLAGGALLGVVGALIAIPVAAGLSLLYDQVLVPRQQALTDKAPGG